MDNMIRIDKDYIEWLKHVKKRFKNTQIKASIKVNDELLRFYWSIGKDIRIVTVIYNFSIESAGCKYNSTTTSSRLAPCLIVMSVEPSKF